MAKALCRKAALFTVLFCALASATAGDNLAVGYYKHICPAAEPIVFGVVKSAFHSSPEIAAKLIRLHFHDCFVRGCDGSVLIDSISGQFVAEKDSPANNPSLGGFNVIDNAKTLLEKICPKKVSCADIVAFAARDSAFLASPIRYPLWWDVPAGRKDGNISLASNIPGNLPPPTFSVTQLTQLFASKGLSQDEMVTLSGIFWHLQIINMSTPVDGNNGCVIIVEYNHVRVVWENAGAHTIGVSHCTSFVSRLYNFNGPNTTDPSLDPSYAQKLKRKCPQGSPNNANTTMVMDPETPFILDNLYYNDVIAKRGLFTSDATLVTNPNTKSSVFGNSGSYHLVAWQKKFAAAMIKMGEISVLTGTQGGVHAKCRVANS